MKGLKVRKGGRQGGTRAASETMGRARQEGEGKVRMTRGKQRRRWE